MGDGGGGYKTGWAKDRGAGGGGGGLLCIIDCFQNLVTA